MHSVVNVVDEHVRTQMPYAMLAMGWRLWLDTADMRGLAH